VTVLCIHHVPQVTCLQVAIDPGSAWAGCYICPVCCRGWTLHPNVARV